ncbi:glycosyltransferase [Falsirhodobacter sp. alg1]|uniref:CgeB family protein n=1 Tax=Falsirhodobacter sp. alg1 TaxID=1472418 RepID=UPI0005EF47A0|nr:glycosyltransferase [Falsirhodobacter sp. alg1]
MSRGKQAPRIVPVLHNGLILFDAAGTDVRLTLDGAVVASAGGRASVQTPDNETITLGLDTESHSPVTIRQGGWSGQIGHVAGRIVTGVAQDLQNPDRPVAVVAFSGPNILAYACADDEGRFRLILPQIEDGPIAVHIGIAGSDYLLAGGPIAAGKGRKAPVRAARKAARTLRIKIATPNLKEAPMWGDYHFANSLRVAMERLGQRASVDTHDAWYSRPEDQDIALVLRGRIRYVTNPDDINLMWLISHPDRIETGEFDDYDHVAVASDIYAARLQSQGVAHASTLHQATDAVLFGKQPEMPRIPASLFVGNSRREYRTMVRWCIQRRLPLELYGGGWDGVVDPALVRAPSIANADLPQFYASHLVLLNDHWDSMRTNGFLSNRLFDGSGTGTPILTDSVAGLEKVFGDTISTADDIDAFAAGIEDCLAHPGQWLARAAEARRIVLGAHTFDHRAAQIIEMIERAS